VTMLASLKQKLERLRRDDESGAAMLEFAIVFPAQLLFTLGIIQLSLILMAEAMVNHAAFAAARAALVADVPLRPGAAIDATTQARARLTAARHAAAYILSTIADNIGNEQAGVPAQGAQLTWNTQKGPAGIAAAEGAYGKTKVTIMPTPQREGYVAVKVQHDFVLVIPVVCHLFARLPGFVNPGDQQDPAVLATGVAAMRIIRVGFVGRPWLPATDLTTAVDGAGGDVAVPGAVVNPGG
jgi:Flp pilus assembly protein TadG